MVVNSQECQLHPDHTPVRPRTGSSAPRRSFKPRAPAFIPNSKQTPIIVDSSTYTPPSRNITPDNAPWVNPVYILHPIPVHLPVSPRRVLLPSISPNSHGSPKVQIPEGTAIPGRLMSAQPMETPMYGTAPGIGPQLPPYHQEMWQQGIYHQGGYNQANNYINYEEQYISPQNSQDRMYAQSQSQITQMQQPYVYAQSQPHYTQTRQYHSQIQHLHTYNIQQAYPQNLGLQCYCEGCMRYRIDMEWYGARAYAYEMAQGMRMRMQHHMGMECYGRGLVRVTVVVQMRGGS
ncbi:hypothetical protein BGX38DRAFT_1244681 [Terfezia claveryi]|nr:hypothetical protein BGX38DRAFT_1244681 [Terfezia claveryi]